MGWSAFGPTLPPFSERTSFKDGSRPLSPSSPISHYLVGRRESAHLYPRAAIISISPWLMPRMGTRGRASTKESGLKMHASHHVRVRPSVSHILSEGVTARTTLDCDDDEAAFRPSPKWIHFGPVGRGHRRTEVKTGGGRRLAQTVRNFKAAHARKSEEDRRENRRDEGKEGEYGFWRLTLFLFYPRIRRRKILLLPCGECDRKALFAMVQIAEGTDGHAVR